MSKREEILEIEIEKGKVCIIDNIDFNQYNGKVVKYSHKSQSGKYYFITNSNQFIRLENEKDFIIMPTKEEILSLIDISIDIRDEQWFLELSKKLNHLSK